MSDNTRLWRGIACAFPPAVLLWALIIWALWLLLASPAHAQSLFDQIQRNNELIQQRQFRDDMESFAAQQRYQQLYGNRHSLWGNSDDDTQPHRPTH